MDAWSEIARWPEVVVHTVASSGNGDCSVAGQCNLRVSPAEITIANDLSPGRRTFTLLHEIGHYLQQNDPPWVDGALAKQPDFGRRLEEQVCDAFAAEVLLGSNLHQRVLGSGIITATSVQQLFDASQASRSACCVKVAQLLPVAGWVVLSDMSGTVVFSAVSGDRFPPTAGTYQGDDHISLRAATFGSAQSEDAWISFPSGKRWSSLYADSVRDPSFRYVYTVLTDEVPPWLPSYTQRSKSFVEPGWECHVCGLVAEAVPDDCPNCHASRCWRCGMCACGQRANERRCSKCNFVYGLGMFDKDSPLCRECA
ncbi:ImmA/IrrE family metallo-endopeptidase [Dactylosporangium sp. NBC_01737]|uniref:ImmA/IrrE family metallo-endopeptidase n=1 Tax=Dactylosporangium sp. NBC_01737 TaxID=2975959 RepID=UPI003FA358FE